MAEPHEIIEKLNKETPRKTKAEEMKRRWLEENPGRVPDDFNTFKFKNSGVDWKAWEAKTSEIIGNNDSRWEIEKIQIPDLMAIDTTLKVQASFENSNASKSYESLLDVFGDDHFSFTNGTAVWYLPNDPNTRAQWQTLSNTTQAEVQRHATDLASVVANTRQIATNEVQREKGAGSAVTEWQNSELYKVLQSLESSLKQWDKLLAVDAFPDRNALNKDFDLIQQQFFQFYREHVPLYGQETTVSYINYQMLATMKSLAEKVAAQFAARAGKPSFSGMYDLICDVPNRGSYEKGNLTAQYLTKENAIYPSGKVWKKELESLGKDLAKANPGASTRLQGELNKLMQKQPPVDLEASLNKWYQTYKNIGSDLSTLPDLHRSIGEIAFGLGKYKEAVDAVLRPTDANSTVNSPQIQAIRQRYQEIFDGFVMHHQQEILLCKSLLL